MIYHVQLPNISYHVSAGCPVHAERPCVPSRSYVGKPGTDFRVASPFDLNMGSFTLSWALYS